MPTPLPVDTLRERFPIFKSQVYINSCSQGALSVDVRRAYDDYLCDWDERGAPWEYWVEMLEKVRTAIAELINASPDEIAITTSVSQAVSALASGLRFDRQRHKIVSTMYEFPTVGQVWHAQESHGAKVIHVPAAGNVIPLDYFDKAIDDQTLVVSLSHVCFRNGSKVDVPAIVHMAHRRGAMVLLDSYQALGTMPIDVQALGVDFHTGGVLKYLLSSAGLAYLYVQRDHIKKLQPTAIGWFSQENIFAMDPTANRLSPTARRFESGTPPIPNIYAALAGLKLVKQIGIERIETHIRDLTDALIEGAMRAGFNVVTPLAPKNRGALVTLKAKDVNQLVKQLAAHGIITSSRDNNLRISPHFYNTHADIDAVLGALKKHRDLLV
ncbi:MAG: aminotransferase class V-fold PLP-dependent enzyme [Anaerolineae bacterium]|nr:aminotransferase class V-fold PLP-dependent enzyme [Anaerolineae bacterium]